MNMVCNSVNLGCNLQFISKTFGQYPPVYKKFIQIKFTFRLNAFIKCLAICILLIISSKVSAQQTFLEDNYVKDLSDSLLIRAGLNQKFTSIKINESSSSSNLIYEPNTRADFSFGFAYKWVGLNIAFKAPGNGSSEGEKSKGLDLRINSYGRRLGFDVSYSSLNGFNFKESYTTDSVKTVDFRPDLHSRRISFTGFYNLNPSKFSLRAITLQNERQLKSSGSPILGVYVNHITFETKDSTSILEPLSTGIPNTGITFPENLYFKKVRSFNFGAKIGYMYTLVIKKRFFTSLGINVGLGYDHSIYSYEDKADMSLNKLQVFAGGRFAIGYNTDNFYVGFFTHTAQSIVNVEGYNVNFEQGLLRFVFAKRFSGKFKLLNKLFKTKVAKAVAPKS